MDDVTPLAYRIPVAARISGLGRSTIYREIDRGALPSVKVAGRRLILHADLQAYLARGKAQSA
jgi:excisionase family DNA binding protein